MQGENDPFVMQTALLGPGLGHAGLEGGVDLAEHGLGQGLQEPHEALLRAGPARALWELLCGQAPHSLNHLKLEHMAQSQTPLWEWGK